MDLLMLSAACMTAPALAPATRNRTTLSAILVVLLVIGLLPGGPTTAQEDEQERTSWEGLLLPPGVEGEVVEQDLDFPTGLDWDDDGNLYVSLVGFAPENRQILRIDENGSQPLDLEGADLTAQILDLTHHNGQIYFSTTGRIHVHDLESGQTETIVTGLPAWGDHRTDEIVIGPDGRLYVGQGTVTNSGVIGFDQLGLPNAINNVSGDRPTYRDVPCEDVTLSGYNWETTHPFVVNTTLNAEEGAGNDVQVVNFTSEEEVQNYQDEARNVSFEGAQDDGDGPAEQDPGPADQQDPGRQDLWLTWEETGLQRVITGPFSPFATATYQGQTLEGDPRCSGSVISMEPDGSDLRAEAWGFRNPFALKFDDEDRLWVADNGPDKRGSRPLGPGPDTIQHFEIGGGNDTLPWFGWPDHTLGIPYDDPFFASPWGPDVVPVFDEPPSEPITQFTFSGAHASSNKFDFGPNGTTYEDSLFIAEFGSLGYHLAVGAFSGMNVARVDLDDGRVTEFIVGEDRWSGDFRPVEAVFGPDDRLWVVDFGPATHESGDGNATHGQRYNEVLQPGQGRILAFDLPDDMDWEGRPVGNPGGQGQEPSGGERREGTGGGAVVQVFDYGFTADDEYVVGEPVAFRNVGEVGHTATDYNSTFNSGFELAPDTTFAWTPEEAGTYQFYCAVHPGMTGTITVQDGLEEEEGEDEDEVPAVGVVGLIVTVGALLWWARPRKGPEKKD